MNSLTHFTDCIFMTLLSQKNILMTLRQGQIIGHGLVVRIVDFELLAPFQCGFESSQGLRILSCEEAIQLAYGMSVVLLKYPLVPEIMHRGAPDVFLHK